MEPRILLPRALGQPLAPSRFNPRLLGAMGAELLVVPPIAHVRDLLRGQLPTINGTPTHAVRNMGGAGAAGLGKGYAADTTGYLSYSGLTSASARGNTAVLLWTKTGTLTVNNKYAVLFSFSSTLNTGFQSTTVFASGTGFAIYYGGTQIGSTITLTDGDPYMVIASVQAAGAGSAYLIRLRNLRTGAITSQSGTATISAAGASTWELMGSSFFGGYGYPGDMYLGAMGSAYMPPQVADEWIRDPWLIVEDEPATVTIGEAGGPASYTLTAAAGSFTETGQDAGLLAARLITGETGAFTETGQDAGLLVGRVVTGETGAFALTGKDATLTYTPAGAYTLAADAGSFAETGQDAGLLAARLITGAAGAFAETGQDASLYVGRVVAADTGSFTETGQDAGLLVARRIAGDVGAFVETGQDAALIYSAAGGYTLTAAVGTFALTGNDATLTNHGPFVPLPASRRIGKNRLAGAAARLGAGAVRPPNPRIGD